MKKPTDKEMLDWLQRQIPPKGNQSSWECNMMWINEYPHHGGPVACFGSYASSVRRAITKAMREDDGRRSARRAMKS